MQACKTLNKIELVRLRDLLLMRAMPNVVRCYVPRTAFGKCDSQMVLNLCLDLLHPRNQGNQLRHIRCQRFYWPSCISGLCISTSPCVWCVR